MNYGPLEFAEYLRRKRAKKKVSVADRAGLPPAPAPADKKELSQLTIVGGSTALTNFAHDAQVEAVSACEQVKEV